MRLAHKLDEFAERQGIRSAEFIRLTDLIEQKEEAYDQLVEKIKLLDALRENAELKLEKALLKIKELRSNDNERGTE